MVENDDKEMTSMKKAREAEDYLSSTFKRLHVFEDSPNTIINLSDIKDFKLNK